MKKKYILLPLIISLSALSCGNKRAIPNEVVFTLEDYTYSERHTEKQNLLLNSDNPSSYIKTHQSEFGKENDDRPLGLSFAINERNDTGDVADYYEIELSEDSEFTLSYRIRSNTRAELFNLKNGVYYYKLHSYHGGKEFVSEESKTITVNASAPRNVYIDGVINSRDLGGWDIGENRIYKQGMIYRTAQYNYSKAKTDPFISEPTESGLYTVKNELKIKTDIDLRRYDEVAGITSSPLGSDVKYVHVPMFFNNQNIFTNASNKQSIQTFFNTLADESNYPIAFHCVRGTDRTGALAYALGALVGMSEKDLMMDYLFSNLAPIKSLIYEENITGDDFYVQGIRNSEGSTLSEKAKNYLMSNVEVSESTLNSIINILVESL